MINLNYILFKKLLINKFKPSSRKDIKDYRSFIDYLRNTGKEKILERLNALKNQDYVPSDILTTILHNWSIFYRKISIFKTICKKNIFRG